MAKSKKELRFKTELFFSITGILVILLFSALIFSPKQEKGETDWSQYLNSSSIIQCILHEQMNFTNRSVEEELLIPVELIFQNATKVNELLKEKNITNVRIMTKEEFEQFVKDYIEKCGLSE